MLRQLKVRRHVATMLCLLTVVGLVATRALHDRRAEAHPPALIAGAAHPSNARVRKRAAIAGSGRMCARTAAVTSTCARTAAAPSSRSIRRCRRTWTSSSACIRRPTPRWWCSRSRTGACWRWPDARRREPDKSVADLTMKPWAPAASIFKLVTATALIEHGVSPDDARLLPRRRALGGGVEPALEPAARSARATASPSPSPSRRTRSSRGWRTII